jgi:hypothetical protein
MSSMKQAINRDIQEIQNYFPVDLSSKRKLLFSGKEDSNIEDTSSLPDEEGVEWLRATFDA